MKLGKTELSFILEISLTGTYTTIIYTHANVLLGFSLIILKQFRFPHFSCIIIFHQYSVCCLLFFKCSENRFSPELCASLILTFIWYCESFIIINSSAFLFLYLRYHFIKRGRQINNKVRNPMLENMIVAGNVESAETIIEISYC